MTMSMACAVAVMACLPASSALAASCESLAKLALEGTAITRAEVVAPGTFQPPDGPPRGRNPPRLSPLSSGGRKTDKVAYRRLLVDTDVPVHGRVLPIAQVLQDIQRMTKAAEAICARTQSAGVFGPGCPVKAPSAIIESPAR